MNNAKKVLEIGAGHGRDTIFFASNGIEVEALDYSVVTVEILDKMAKEKKTANKITNLCCQQSASKKQKENKLVTSR